MVEINEYQLHDNEKPRRLFILKGKTFATAKQKYLFIVHDAQNFFDDKYTSNGNSCQIEAALKQLGISKYLVAGLECKRGFNRFQEFSPVPITTFIAKRYKVDPTAVFGQQYLALLRSRLISYLETKYHFIFKEVKSCMIGCSMGGVITTYEAFNHPRAYNGFIAFSPALFANKPHIHQFITAQHQIGNYFYAMGGKEKTGAIANAKDYIDAYHFLTKQIATQNNKNVQSHYDPNGIHSEKSWSQLLPMALQWFIDLP